MQILKRTGLDQTLTTDGPITLFAPTDTAFRNLSALLGAARFRELIRDTDTLTTLMQGHMVKGSLTTADLRARASEATGKARLDTLAGGQLVIEFDRFVSREGKASVKVGTSFQPTWQAWVSDHSVLIDNGSVVPIDLLVVPQGMR